MSLAHPGIVEAGMSLREARREAWDGFVAAIGDYAQQRRDRFTQAKADELVGLQGQAQALISLHAMLAQVDKHFETLMTQKAKPR